MYDSATASLSVAGLTLSSASFIWWPMAIFAMIAMTIALGRIFLKRDQIQP